MVVLGHILIASGHILIAPGHIAGIPVEETLLGLAPLGAVGVGAAWFAVRGRAERMRRLVSRLSRRRPR